MPTLPPPLPPPPPPQNPPISTYRVRADMVHIEHPNNLGTTESTGLAIEALRLRRFRSVYISRNMHLKATHDINGPHALLFRTLVDDDFLTLCRRKRCFHREFLPPRPFSPPPSPRISRLSHEHEQQRPPPPLDARATCRLLHLRARTALKAARQLYGTALMSDVELGFTRPIGRHETFVPIPCVKQLLATNVDHPAYAEEDVLSFAVSYRHDAAPGDRVINGSTEQWRTLLTVARAVCDRLDKPAFRLWTDQMLSARTPSGTLRWTAAALLPYTVHPTIYVAGAAGFEADQRRLWLSLERLAASFGHGVLHADGSAALHLGREVAVTASKNVAWSSGLGLDMPLVVRKVCGAVMCGFARDKVVRFPHDGQAILEFAAVLSSSVTFGDIGHAIRCRDCTTLLGFSDDLRVLTLLSSCTTVDKKPFCAALARHPPMRVPALRLCMAGRTWDGFREWTAETAVWGAVEDSDSAVARALVSSTKGLQFAHRGAGIGHFGTCVLQLCVADCGNERVLVGFMAVRVALFGRSRYAGVVEWCQRIWPGEMGRMWQDFESLYRDVDDRDAVMSMASMVSSCSDVQFSDICAASEVSRVNLRKVRW